MGPPFTLAVELDGFSLAVAHDGGWPILRGPVDEEVSSQMASDRVGDMVRRGKSGPPSPGLPLRVQAVWGSTDSSVPRVVSFRVGVCWFEGRDGWGRRPIKQNREADGAEGESGYSGTS